MSTFFLIKGLFFQQNLDELTDTAVPGNIRLNRAMDLEQPYSKFLS